MLGTNDNLKERVSKISNVTSGIITFYLGKIPEGGDKMNRTANVILFKFLMTLVFAGIALGFVGGNTFEWVLLVAILGTVIDYLVGDLFILPRVGGLAAAVINGILEALIAFVVAIVVPTLMQSGDRFRIAKHDVLSE